MTGFELEPFHRNISDDDLLQNLTDVWSKLGRQPKFRDCQPDISKYSAHTYADRFGSWRNALQRVVEWTAQRQRPEAVFFFDGEDRSSEVSMAEAEAAQAGA